jgi:hypothetical protein
VKGLFREVIRGRLIFDREPGEAAWKRVLWYLLPCGMSKDYVTSIVTLHDVIRGRVALPMHLFRCSPRQVQSVS